MVNFRQKLSKNLIKIYNSNNFKNTNWQKNSPSNLAKGYSSKNDLTISTHFDQKYEDYNNFGNFKTRTKYIQNDSI